MTRIERYQERVSDPPTAEDIQQKATEGWKLVAVEWQREVPQTGTGEDWPGATPYGLVTLEGDTRLQEDSDEEETLRLMLGLVIDDRNSLTEVAEELNRRGLRTRNGTSWRPGDVFNLLPRLVEVAPRVYSSPGWQAAAPAVTH